MQGIKIAVKHGGPSSQTPSRYVVGFDLGTTNSAVTYVDTSKEPWRIETFAIPQLVAPGQIESRETLPSFHYQTAPGEFAVGVFARDQGTLVPGRSISSAKSWLCHTGVDRTAALLPWRGAADAERLSPVEVSSRYLAHVRDAWNKRFPKHPLAEQDFVLTLPASFDEVARELTVKAAAQAGLPRVVLIEEPQAAFYSWIYDHANDWDQLVSPGQKILVCDIGGGTSDFTLIRVRRGEGGKVQFHRVAVGDHLILGGDNFDLTLAQHVERKIGKLEPRQWATLVRTCRTAKETLLGHDAPERMTLTLPGAGSKLLGAGVQVELTRDEVCTLLVEGFLPRVRLDEKPVGRRSGFQEFGLPFAPDAAITRYLAAFLTAHRHVALDDIETPVDHDPARPDIVLFNGGVFESPLLRDRLLEVLESWFNGSQEDLQLLKNSRGPTVRGSLSEEPPSPPAPLPQAGEGSSFVPAPLPKGEGSRWHPILLDNDRLDLAVARGAAYYGMVRRGQGVRIAAGLARTYYIGVETAAVKGDSPIFADTKIGTVPSPQAICLLPAGIEPGHDVELTQRRFDLLVSEPAEFPLFVSSTRLIDKPGEVVAIDREQMTPLPPMRTVLRTRKKTEQATETVSVTLHARLTEIGTLDLWCGEIGGRRSWRLQFDVRSTTQTDMAAHESAAEGEGMVDESVWRECQTLIENTFSADGLDKPEGLVKRLAAALDMSRNLWPTSLCRRIWESLMDCEAGRRRGAVYEARWLNLLGFALRPGYGLAVDDWRVAQTWTTLQGKFAHASGNVRVEGWILWRRIAGGLAAGQQQALAEPLLGLIRGLHRQLTTGHGRSDFGFAMHETAEMWRLLGSLELLSPDVKTELGSMLLDLLPKRTMAPARSAMIWALGRVGARVPMYGPLNAVVPAETAGAWLEKLEIAARTIARGKDDAGAKESSAPLVLAVMQLARRTDDRYRDLPERVRREAVDWLSLEKAPPHFIELVRAGGALDGDEQGLIFGESLPKGLRISS